jgi:hypothetical protein
MNRKSVKEFARKVKGKNIYWLTLAEITFFVGLSFTITNFFFVFDH